MVMLDQRTISQTNYDWQSEKVIEHTAHRECAYALLRATLGLVFLFAGIGKFMMGIGTFASGLQETFAGKLPTALIMPFGYALPVLEVVAGLLLVSGLFNYFGSVLAGLMMMALIFGKLIEGDAPTVGHNLLYSVIVFLLIWFSDYNGYSLDRLLRGRKAKH
jgi:thiosulfate dehydrogenase [quinone] large subunit